MKLSKQDQQYDYIESIHNMVISIMLMIGIALGFYIYYITGYLIAVPLCLIGSFIYPLGDSIRRRITRK